jgi:transposase
MFKIAWRTVGRMVRSVVDEFLPDNLLDKLEYIGVDETSYKRGHRYITVVTDHVRGVVVWIGKGKGADTLAEFFKKLGPERTARLKLVTMDMSDAYIKAVREHAPQVDIVFDRFHVVKLLLDALDEVRKQEYWKLEGAERSVLKNTRFALMCNPRHLRPSYPEVIARVKTGNNKLYRSYQLRVDFEQFWDIHDESQGRDFLMRWTRAALKSRLEPFRKFAHTVRKHIEGILGFIRWPGSNNARAEGMNNKIKLCIHRAFGFHDEDAMIGMIQLCCSGIELV